MDATGYQTDLAGTTFLAVDAAAGGETVTLHDVTTGATIGRVNASKGQTHLAADGSYVWVAGTDKIEGWSPSGVKLFTKTGDYYPKALVYGAPDGVRIAKGAAGANVIETISTSTGQATQSAPFLGVFDSWSQDGQNFVTYQAMGNVVRYYSKDVGAPLATKSLAGASFFSSGSQGNYYWVYPYDSDTPTIYSVAGSTATVEGDIGAPTHSLAFGRGTKTVTVISLDSGPQLVKKSVTLPMPDSAKILSIVASLDGEWVAMDTDKVIYDSHSTAADFGCGRVSSIASSAGRTVALATTRGGIFLASATSDHGTLFRRIPLQSTHVELSANGGVLAADGPDQSVHIYSLPNGAGHIVRSSPPDAQLVSFTLAQGGTRLAQVYETTAAAKVTRVETDLDGAMQEFGDNGVPATPHKLALPLFLSPDGSRVAFSNGFYLANVRTPGTVNTLIYKNGSLLNTVPGATVGWLDDGHLMTQVLKPEEDALDSTIYDASGTALSSNTLIPKDDWRVLSASEIMGRDGNQVVDVNTGQVVVPPPVPPEITPRGIGPNYIIGYDGGRVYTRAR